MTKLTDSVFAVEVPEGGRKFTVQRPYKTSAMCLYYKYGIEEQWYYIKLPPGNWRVLCTTRGATEQQARGIVMKMDMGFSDVFMNYATGLFEYDTAIDSLRSLITSKGLDESKNYVLLKKG